MAEKTQNIHKFYILIIIYILWEYVLKESMVSHQVNDKVFKVYDKFNNYDTAGKMLYEIDSRIGKLLNHLDYKYLQSDKYEINKTLKERLTRLIKNYNDDHLKENFPSEYKGYGKKPDSSFTLNKKKLAICLRDENTKKFHDMNDIMFVVIHEIAHIINPTFGHPKSFWQYMKFLIHEAVEIGIYKPFNYSKKHIKYCNTMLKANPYYGKMECKKGIPNIC